MQPKTIINYYCFVLVTLHPHGIVVKPVCPIGTIVDVIVEAQTVIKGNGQIIGLESVMSALFRTFLLRQVCPKSVVLIGEGKNKLGPSVNFGKRHFQLIIKVKQQVNIIRENRNFEEKMLKYQFCF